MEARSRSLLRRTGFAFHQLFLLAYCGVLLGGFAVQFIAWEYPCPLCILQRMAMMLCAMGPAYVIVRSRSGEVTYSDVMTGLGMALVGAAAGSLMSARQVLLHIVPPDPGYGSEILGLHLYTWALITFFMVFVAAGVYLLFGERLVPGAVHYGGFSRMLLFLFTLIILANAVAVFFQEGFHWFLPDNPDTYRLRAVP
ncbi:disulfide bond formation protein B [Streptomyces sp. TRM72054]|uniref:disulfide bond formation protein B n=1 Tax=Streptomyces sp. TRM72054 TaxID=2870562 RepID=UPI001C8B5EF2|nr:disulfide bond formation protein B [Streptomyces sp. TRM72054]MBX9399538.1 disulfide bond formation protein B [Streptomyces sp. TRM72054]